LTLKNLIYKRRINTMSNIGVNKKKNRCQPLILTAVAAIALAGGCAYPTYDDKEAFSVEEQHSVWQYLNIYSIYQERLPKSIGSMSPDDMFNRINDTLHGVRYTDYVDDWDSESSYTRFSYPVAFTSSTVYFYLPEFSYNALAFFKDNLEELKQYQNIIIDVRYNGGGLLDVTDTILGVFLPYNTAYIKMRERTYNDSKYAGETIEHEGRTKLYPALRNKKIAVLMNGWSASASEILAAGLKDGANAYLVGRQSYGKGIGQVIIPRGGKRKQLRITNLEISGLTNRTGQYHRIGIEPDSVPDQIKSYVDAHVPNASLRVEIQDWVEEAIQDTLAKNPDIDTSEYRQELTAEYERYFREPYYALKQLDPGFAFADDGGDDVDGDGGDDVDVVDDVDGDNGGGETAKRRAAALRDAKGIDKIAARIRGAKANWRPMGAVIVDEKDLPNIKLSDD